MLIRRRLFAQVSYAIWHTELSENRWVDRPTDSNERIRNSTQNLDGCRASTAVPGVSSRRFGTSIIK